MIHVLNHLWQSTLFVAAVALLAWVLRHNRARARYWLWFAASVKFLLPFSLLMALGSHVSWPSPALTPLSPALSRLVAPFPADFEVAPPVTTPGIADAQQIPPAGVTAAPLQPIAAVRAYRGTVWRVLCALWGTGTLIVLACWTVRWLRIRRALRDSVPLSIAAPIPVRASVTPIEPGMVGIIRPVLLLPQGIEQHLGPEQLQTIMLHELDHVRRRDNLTAAIHMLIQALFWFYPLVWWLGRRLIAERENACDEAVTAAGCDRETYAQGILNVCRFYLQLPLACTAGVAGADLKKRIESIMRPRPLRTLNALVTLLLLAGAAATVLAPIALGSAGAAAPNAPGAPAASGTHQVSRQLLEQGDYAQLDQRVSGFQDAYKAGTLDEFALMEAFGAFMVADPALETHFDGWLSAYPTSYAAHLARAMYYFKSGVQTRGKRYASHTTAEQMRGMQAYLAKSQRDAQASLALDSKPMASYNILLRIGLELNTRDANRELLAAALKLDPVALIARRPYMNSLETRWGGSLNQMLEFLQESRSAGLTDVQLAPLQKQIDNEREWLKHEHLGDQAATAVAAE